MVAARAFLTTVSIESHALKAAIPIVSGQHFGATGLKALDANGDLRAEDTAFIGVVKNGESYEIAYYAFHDGMRDECTVLEKPRERKWYFSPQA